MRLNDFAKTIDSITVLLTSITLLFISFSEVRIPGKIFYGVERGLEQLRDDENLMTCVEKKREKGCQKLQSHSNLRGFVSTTKCRLKATSFC